MVFPIATSGATVSFSKGESQNTTFGLSHTTEYEQPLPGKGHQSTKGGLAPCARPLEGEDDINVLTGGFHHCLFGLLRRGSEEERTMMVPVACDIMGEGRVHFVPQGLVMYEPNESNGGTKTRTKRKVDSDDFESQHPKKLYIRKHLKSMRPDSDANSTGEGQASTPESNMGFKSPDSVLSEMDSLADIASLENPSSVKNISLQPWTPPSLGSIMSPGTPYSLSSLGTPKSSDSCGTKPPSVCSVDYHRDDELLDLSLPPKKDFSRRSSMESRHRLSSPQFHYGESVRNGSSDLEHCPTGTGLTYLQRSKKPELQVCNGEGDERGPVAKYPHLESTTRLCPPHHTQDTDEETPYSRRTALRDDHIPYEERMYREKLCRERFMSPRSLRVMEPSLATPARVQNLSHDFDIQRDYGDHHLPPNASVMPAERLPVNANPVTSGDICRDYSTGIGSVMRDGPAAQPAVRCVSRRAPTNVDPSLERSRYHEQNVVTANSNDMPESKRSLQQDGIPKDGSSLERSDSIPSLLPILAPSIEEATARRVQRPSGTEVPVYGLKLPMKMSQNGQPPERSESDELVIEDISGATEARDVQKMLEESQIKHEPREDEAGGEAASHEAEDRPDVDVRFCQVCGDNAAGFHCGAYVCEACKKFFVRCIKSENLKFSCPRSMNCEITRETRTRCQYCRYIKCIALGMYKPGGTNVSSQISHMPCSVCGAPSSGFHFGAITCEGCKGFFRRTVKERDMQKYECSRQGTCAITTATRNICKFCRYQKCLDVGMKPNGSRIGRQPNAIKHATMMQLQEIKMAKGLPVDFQGTPQNIKAIVSKSEEIIAEACSNVVKASGESRPSHESFHDAPRALYRSASCGGEAASNNEQTSVDNRRERTGSLGEVESLKNGHNHCPPNCKDSSHSAVSNVYSGAENGRDEHVIKSSNSIPSRVAASYSHASREDTKASPDAMTKRYHPLPSSTAVSSSALSNGCPLSPSGVVSHVSPVFRDNSTADIARESRDRVAHSKQDSFFDQRRRHSEDSVFRPDVETVKVGPLVEKPMARFPTPDMRFLPRGFPSPVPCVGNPSLMPPPLTHIRHIPFPYPQQQMPRLPHPMFPGYPTQSSHSTQSSVPSFHLPLPESSQSSFDRNSSNLNYHRENSERSLPQYSMDNVSAPVDSEVSLNVLESSAHDPAHVYSRPHEACPPAYHPSPANHTSPGDHVSPEPSPSLKQRTDLNPPSLDASADSANGSRRTADSLLRTELTRSLSMPTVAQVIEQVQDAYRDLMPILRRCPDIPAEFNPASTLHDLWDIQMAQFKQCAHATLKFSKNIPGFKKLSIQDQIARVQDCMYPIVMTVLASKYNADTRQYCYFNYTKTEEQQIMTHFPWFADLIVTFHVIGIPVQLLDMDNTELSFLCAFKLLSGCDVMEYEGLLIGALEEYCRDKGEHAQTRAGLVLLRLNELARINQIHHKTVIKGADELVRYGIEIPQLFQESFLND